MRLILIGILFLGIALNSSGQTVSISEISSAEDFSIFSDQVGTFSIYKSNTSTSAVSVFRKIELNDKLEVTSSNELKIDGSATLISYLTVDSIRVYVFRVEIAKNESLSFVVTNDSDEIISSFRKPLTALNNLFDDRLGKFEDLRLALIAQDNNEIIIYPYFEGGRSGKVFSIEPLTGKTIWVLKERLNAIQVIATNDRLVVLSEKSRFLERPDYSIQFFDLKDGSLVGDADFYDPSVKRTIGTFTLLGKNIVVLGDELIPTLHINNLYVFIYDLNGNLITKKIEAKSFDPDLRFRGVGTVKNEDGHLLVFGESFRRSYLKGSARTVYSGAFIMNIYASIVEPSVVYIPVSNFGRGHWEDVVENFKVYKINAQNLSIMDSYTFQTERRSGFTKFYSFDRNVLVRLGKKIWYYNVDESSVPPKFITSVDENKEIMITSFGLISLENKAGTIVLEKLLSD